MGKAIAGMVGGARSCQVAAIPVRVGDDGSLGVLLVTSRDTGRWVVPKGWPMKGRTAFEAAAQEAREEAGVVGRIGRKPVGSYVYFKRQAGFFEVCEVDVFLLQVERQLKTWREKGQRQARWCTVDEAASLVDEPGLRAMILGIAAPSAGGSDRSPPAADDLKRR